MVDVAIGIDALIPAAHYRGSLTDNTRSAFDALAWEDVRTKPTWDDVVIAATDADKPTMDMVRKEAQRRMIILVGARDAEHLETIISNGLREAARLLQKEVDDVPLTSDELVRKATLNQIDGVFENIRAVSNEFEGMETIPSDFADDVHWL